MDFCCAKIHQLQWLEGEDLWEYLHFRLHRSSRWDLCMVRGLEDWHLGREGSVVCTEALVQWSMFLCLALGMIYLHNRSYQCLPHIIIPKKTESYRTSTCLSILVDMSFFFSGLSLGFVLQVYFQISTKMGFRDDFREFNIASLGILTSIRKRKNPTSSNSFQSSCWIKLSCPEKMCLTDGPLRSVFLFGMGPYVCDRV